MLLLFAANVARNRHRSSAHTTRDLTATAKCKCNLLSPETTEQLKAPGTRAGTSTVYFDEGKLKRERGR